MPNLIQDDENILDDETTLDNLLSAIRALQFQTGELTMIAARHSATLHHLIESFLHQGSDIKPRLVSAAAEHSDALEKLKVLLDLQQQYREIGELMLAAGL